MSDKYNDAEYEIAGGRLGGDDTVGDPTGEGEGPAQGRLLSCQGHESLSASGLRRCCAAVLRSAIGGFPEGGWSRTWPSLRGFSSALCDESGSGMNDIGKTS